jgi:hypothetical protein
MLRGNPDVKSGAEKVSGAGRALAADHAEAQEGFGPELLSGAQDRRREGGLIRTVGEVLSF